jgi:hypothetical protein
MHRQGRFTGPRSGAQNFTGIPQMNPELGAKNSEFPDFLEGPALFAAGRLAIRVPSGILAAEVSGFPCHLSAVFPPGAREHMTIGHLMLARAAALSAALRSYG